jgi:hypothetical protein
MVDADRRFAGASSRQPIREVGIVEPHSDEKWS